MEKDNVSQKTAPGPFSSDLKCWINKTSVHGFPDLYRSKGEINFVSMNFNEEKTIHIIKATLTRLVTCNKDYYTCIFKKIYWASLMLFATVFLSLHLLDITRTYFKYETKVNMKYRQSRQIRFPAITLCNMNPIKYSAVEKSDSTVIKSLFGMSLTIKETRRKRSIGMSCSDPTQIHAESGLCFGVDPLIHKWDEVRKHCIEAHSGSIPFINTQSKWDFLRNSGIINGISGKYYTAIEKGKYYKEIDFDPASFNDLTSGINLDGCVYIDVKNDTNDTWGSDMDCGTELNAVCQNLVRCPFAVYSDGSMDYCYILLDPVLTMRWDDARKMCVHYDPDLTLVELDTQEKVQHVIDSGVLKSAQSDLYWISLKKGRWEESKLEQTYTNTNSGDKISECAAANISENHRWHDLHCGDTQALALCEWRAISIMNTMTTVTSQTPEEETMHVPKSTDSRQISTINPSSQKSTANPFTQDESTISTTRVPPTTTPSPGAPIPVPPKVAGSKHAQRIAVRESFKQQEKIYSALAEVEESIKSGLGYQAEELLLECRYSGQICNWSSNFVRYYNAIHGNCYLFNSGWSNSVPVIMTKNSGRRHGMSIILNVAQEEYIETFGEEAGVRVVVHSQEAMPFPEDEGISIQPGKLTSIGLRKASINRLHGAGNSRCIDSTVDEPDYSKNVFEEMYPVKYTRRACLKTCYQQHVITKCGCGDSSYPRSGTAFPEYVGVCDVQNITQDDCLYEVKQDFVWNRLKCSCPETCRDEIFGTAVSTAAWPSDVYMEKNANFLVGLVSSTEGGSNYKKIITNNLLRLEIYYEDMLEEIITEVAYENARFLSDFGGALSLWFGFSLLTIVEVFQICANLVVGCLHTKITNQSEANFPQNKEEENEISGTSYGCRVTEGETITESSNSYKSRHDRITPQSSAIKDLGLSMPRVTC